MKDNKQQIFECCVLCQKETNILKSTDVSLRNFYVEGAGQLCSDCWADVYKNK